MENKFQANFSPVRLYDENNIPAAVTKVGILPFIVSRTGMAACPPKLEERKGKPPHIQFLFMKPRENARHLGKPAFQLAKGTRRLNVNGNWCDMREEDMRHADESFWEPLADTALREGYEELGLKPSNIGVLFDMGGFVFTSARGRMLKPLHMFAASIRGEKDFDPYEPTTSETCWMTRDEFTVRGREDHVKILDQIVTILLDKGQPWITNNT